VKLLSLITDVPTRPCCAEQNCRALADVVIELAWAHLALCRRHLAELRAAIGRQRQMRAINQKQYTALVTIARAPGERAPYDAIVKAMGRYATNSFNSCVARGWIADSRGDREYSLTVAGRELLAHIEAKL
jgi:hypothetical protein